MGESSYSPASVAARAGVPTELVVRTDGNQGCTRGSVLQALGIEEALPEFGETVIELGELDAGTLRYTCPMRTYSGSIEVTA